MNRAAHVCDGIFNADRIRSSQIRSGDIDIN